MTDTEKTNNRRPAITFKLVSFFKHCPVFGITNIAKREIIIIKHAIGRVTCPSKIPAACPDSPKPNILDK